MTGERNVTDNPSVESETLEHWALGYLGRYASSAENLRRVLTRRVRRRTGNDTEAVRRASPLIAALVARYVGAGLIDDDAYAAARAASRHRRGDSLRAIRAGLAAKGVAAEAAAAAVAALHGAAPDPDLAAACAFARRRRLGPYRRGDADRTRELAAFARAGFGRREAEAVLGCGTIAEVEALTNSEKP
ncbi:MAG TPA: RecX family transcriptional regulator [Stellaceae bacterium]|nr:RecX family transcriptional regulator [Stellaceae bacterium]